MAAPSTHAYTLVDMKSLIKYTTKEFRAPRRRPLDFVISSNWKKSHLRKFVELD